MNPYAMAICKPGAEIPGHAHRYTLAVYLLSGTKVSFGTVVHA